jgi:hypothetical protein
MLSKLRSYRPSHATVVAYLALFVALGGSSYAAIKVTGKNVKDSSLTGRDLRNESVTGSDVRGLTTRDFSGQLPAGPQGPPGAQGPQGVQGQQGQDGQDGSPDTPQQVLDKIKQVDGSGSLLDADLLDGMSASAFLGANAKAADADKLDGKDGNDYADRCDPGMVRAGDICHEAGLRNATAWLNAMSTCAGLGRHLPSQEEVLFVFSASPADPFPADPNMEQILTSDFIDDMTVKAPSADKDSFEHGGSATLAVLLRYFCVEAVSNS